MMSVLFVAIGPMRLIEIYLGGAARIEMIPNEIALASEIRRVSPELVFNGPYRATAGIEEAEPFFRERILHLIGQDAIRLVPPS